MTSPWSSPRTLILFPSRLSSFSFDIPLDYSTPLVHGSRRNGLQQVVVVRLERPSTASGTVVLAGIGEHRNGPGVFVHFEHREHLKAARIIEAKAQDYQTRVLSSHLRVRVSAGLVDDGDLLHQWSISPDYQESLQESCHAMHMKVLANSKGTPIRWITSS